MALLLRDVAAAGDAEAYGKAVDAAGKLLGDADAKAVVAEVRGRGGGDVACLHAWNASFD